LLAYLWTYTAWGNAATGPEGPIIEFFAGLSIAAQRSTPRGPISRANSAFGDLGEQSGPFMALSAVGGIRPVL
ncbi:MAG: hypothetical protein ABSG68_15705, partial [Thermoguttaceae bacterium]